MIEHFLIEETRSEKWKIPYNDSCDKRSNSFDILLKTCLSIRFKSKFSFEKLYKLFD